VVLVLTGYVGLSTMCAGIAAPVWLALTTLPADQPLFIYCVAMAAYLVFSHRSNIHRMRTGTENRMTRAMLFRRQS
jgi:glycerol-3-phosphate acyltransferase PlsY